MALAYLLDPTNQYQNVAGVNNVAGWFEVFISDTPERADVYVDFAGTRAPERIGIDNDGRAVMIVDGEGVYRVEMHAPNGDLLWTQYPVWPVGQGGGGGSVGVDIGSSDGSVDVQRTQVGSVVNYDLSVAADSTDLLGWGEYVGYTMDGTHMVPSYNAGTIETGPHGIRLHGGQYYHVTVTLGASSLEQNVYDAFQVSFKGVDGDGAVSTFADKSFHYDASTGEGHSYDVSFDMMPATDIELYAEATGIESGISVGLAEVYVHRVYSGAPFIPETIADKDWVEDNFQEKLTAGNNITIENNVISATAEPQVQSDWAQNNPEVPSYIQHKPTIPSGSQLVPAATVSDAGEVLTVDDQGVPAWAPAQAPISAGNGVDITNNVVSAKVDGSTIGFNSSGELEAIINDDDSAFLAQYGTTTYQEIAAAVQAGKAVFVTGSANALTAVMPMTSFNTNPAMVLFGILIGSTLQTVKLDQGVWMCGYDDIQADWSETNQLKPSYIANKPAIPVVPTMKDLVAGSNVSITESANSVTISATAAPQVNADWNATSGVAEILNKPDIPVLPTMKNLVAGSGVTITEGSTDVTISATGTTYTAGTGIDITNDVISADTTVLALKSELPAIGTITL